MYIANSVNGNMLPWQSWQYGATARHTAIFINTVHGMTAMIKAHHSFQT
jgi:hypothetical protein